MGDGATSACRGEAKVAGRVVFFTKALQPVRLTRLLGVTTRQYTCFPILCGCNCGEQGLVKVTALPDEASAKATSALSDSLIGLTRIPSTPT